MVATSASALVVGVLSVMLATTAQAAHAGSGPSSPGRSVAHVTVLSGQSLWSLAREYDPDADPRAVMAEIIQMNSLGTDQLQAGQVLWLPRG